MKAKFTITIDDHLLVKIRHYAASKKVTVSELVEIHFQNLTKIHKGKNILELVDELQKPAIDPANDLKKAFYKDQAMKP